MVISHDKSGLEGTVSNIKGAADKHNVRSQSPDSAKINPKYHMKYSYSL